ncbi:MAG TPA: hypothetical protein PKY10_03115 [Lentisphaeria bacterium]|nr:hypothetical protein [Lentisphaeria bacterium]
MICPGCGLNNLSDARRCARCGQWLALDGTAAVIAAGPPRAKSRRWLRNRLYAIRRRSGFRWPQTTSATQEDSQSSGIGLKIPAYVLEIVLCMFVPSWSQFRQQRRKRAWFFLGLFVTGLLSLLLTLGTPYRPVAIWLLAMTQACSACDAIPFLPTPSRILKNAAASLLLFWAAASLDHAILAAFIYGQNWETIPNHYQYSQLNSGMLVKLTQETAYQPGDIVAIDTIYYAQRYRYYDRILATGAHRVEICGGKIYIDGKKSERAPLRPDFTFPDWRQNMLPDQFLVLPSAYTIRLLNDANWRGRDAISPIISTHRICGKVNIIFPVWHRLIQQEQP